jgi:hypothetical protein
MHACVGHPKSRATDDHERVTEDLSRRLGENLKDDKKVIQNHPVFAAPPRGSLSSTMPTLHKSSSIQAQAVTRLIYQHSLKQCGMSSEVSERKMAFLGRARVRQINPSQIRTLFLLRESLKDNWLGEILFYLSHALLRSLDWSRTREALTARQILSPRSRTSEPVFFALVFCKSKYRMKMSADLLKIMDGREPWITCECSGAADLLFQSTQTQIKGSDFGVDDHRVPRRFQKQYEMLIATSSCLQWTFMPSATQPPLSTTL